MLLLRVTQPVEERRSDVPVPVSVQVVRLVLALLLALVAREMRAHTAGAGAAVSPASDAQHSRVFRVGFVQPRRRVPKLRTQPLD